jgi:hypothetical protein
VIAPPKSERREWVLLGGLAVALLGYATKFFSDSQLASDISLGLRFVGLAVLLAGVSRPWWVKRQAGKGRGK